MKTRSTANRFDGLYSAAHSAELTGEPATAIHHRQLLAITHSPTRTIRA